MNESVEMKWKYNIDYPSELRSNEMKQSCKTCKWAVWELNENGNSLRLRPGRCTYKITWPILPEVLEHRVILPNLENYGIWRDKSYGATCKCYEEKK